MKNLTDFPVILAFQSDTAEREDENFQVYHDEDRCPEGALEIVHLLQEVLKFRLIFKETKSENKTNIAENDDDRVIYCHPSLEKLQKNSALLFPTFQSRLSALYKSSGLPVHKDLFVRNVTGDLWLYLAGTLVLLTVCLRLSTYIHHRLKPRHGDWSWLEVVQWSLGAICQQGSERHPQGCSCRTMFLVGYMITYMNYTGFAAGITSLLAVTSSAVSLPWHRVLHAQLPLVALCNSQAEKYLKDKARGSQELISTTCVNTVKELTTRAADSSIALMSETTLTQYLNSCSVSEETRCDMSTSTQDRYNYFTGLVVKRSSPLRQPFNYWLLRLKETGLLKRTQKKWLKPIPSCQTSRSYTQVGFEHVQSAFFILEFCVAAALLIAGFEILLHRYKQKINKTVASRKRK